MSATTRDRVGSVVAAAGHRLLRTRALVRLPNLAYRRGWGAVFGSRLLMLEHTGRRSGLRRDVVLEVVARPAADRYVVVSGFGDRAQWYRNVLADPRVRVSVGRRSRARATARVLPVGEAGAVIAGYVEQRPRAWAWFGPVVGRTLGRPVGASAPPPPMVELRLADGQRSPGAPPGG